MEAFGKAISLLLVEDDATSRPTLVKLLSRRYAGLEICSAENGAIGLALYQEKRFDIIISDINMPVLNGIQMVKEIRLIDPGALVIMLTAFSDTNYLLEAINLGVSSYVLKPIDRALLFAATDDCISRIEQRKEIETLNDLVIKRAEELEKLNAELDTTNQELETFNLMVSHDLRQPLHKINLYCQVLLDLNGEELNDESKSHIRNIAGSVHQMDSLIDALLDFARMSHQKLRKQKVDLGNIAAEVALNLAMQYPTRRVEFDIEQGAEAEGDEQLLKVVLDNLMGNAWKYTSKNESARIEFKRTEYEGKPVFYVRDDGVGFEMKNPNDLFSPFHRQHNKAEYEGHGIGLFTVQRIVQRHGGKVWAEGAPSKGATFYFALTS